MKPGGGTHGTEREKEKGGQERRDGVTARKETGQQRKKGTQRHNQREAER